MSTTKSEASASPKFIFRLWLTGRGGMVGVALILYTLIFLAWKHFHWGGEEKISLIGNLAILPPMLLATLMAWRVAMQAQLDSRVRRAWFLIGVGTFSVFLGEGAWAYLENVLHVEPFPSIADMFYLGYYPLVLWGLLTLPGAPQNRRERLVFWFDLLIVLTTACMFVSYFLIIPTAAVNNSDLLAKILATAYPVFSLLLLGGVLALLLRRPEPDSRTVLLLLLAGIGFFLASDLAFGYASLAGTYAVGNWTDSGWHIAQVFMVLAALRQLYRARMAAETHRWLTVLDRFVKILPLLAIVLGYGLVFYMVIKNFHDAAIGMLAGALLLTGGVIGKQIVSPAFANLPIRAKVMLTFFLVSALSVSLVTLTSYLTIRSNLQHAVGTNLKDHAWDRAVAVGTLLAKQSEALEGFVLGKVIQSQAAMGSAGYATDNVALIWDQLAQRERAWKEASDGDPLVQEVLHNEAADELRKFRDTFPGHIDLLLTDKYGVVLAATVRPKNYDQSILSWWQPAFHRGHGTLYMSQPILEPGEEARYMIIVMPVRAHLGSDLVGLLMARYSLKDVEQMLAADSPGRMGENSLLLPTGQMLTSDDQFISLDGKTLERLRATTASDYALMSFEGKSQLVSQALVTSSDPEEFAAFNSLNWALIAYQEREEAFAPLNAAWTTTLLSTFTVLLLTTGLAVVLAQVLVAPISRLTAVARQIGVGNLSTKAEVESRDEIGTLAETFNTMLAALLKALGEQSALANSNAQLSAELERQKGDLEIRVEQRTTDLNTLNRRLQEELSERQRLLQSLRESEERFRLLFAASPDAIFLIDPHDPHTLWPIVDCNELACQMNGYAREELIGQSIDILNLKKGKREDFDLSLENLRNQGVVRGLEAHHRHRDGYTFPIEYSTSLIKVGGRELVLGIDRDITPRKQSEGALQHAKEMAESANRAKNEFLSRMSHELRTPMNAILGFAQLLGISRKEPLTLTQRERVRQIVKGGQHLLDLINEILDISRIEAGRLQISPEPVPVQESIQEVLDLTAPLAADRHIQLQSSLERQANPYVMADRQRLKQVLLNLLSNAVKYNYNGGLVLVSCEQTLGTYWHISITDTGPGISPEDMKRLFVPFERLVGEQSNVKGTGLGLALAKRLVELMGGLIGVESIVGQGSTFWIELPAAERQMDRLQRTVGTGELPVMSGAAHTILYVEDNIANFELIQQVLADYEQIKLLWASDARSGVESARRHQPGLILLDLHLGGRDGSEILKQLKQDVETAAIPVMMISADATPSQIERLISLGAHSYLTKPLDIKHFIQVIEEVLTEKER